MTYGNDTYGRRSNAHSSLLTKFVKERIDIRVATHSQSNAVPQPDIRGKAHKQIEKDVPECSPV